MSGRTFSLEKKLTSSGIPDIEEPPHSARSSLQSRNDAQQDQHHHSNPNRSRQPDMRSMRDGIRSAGRPASGKLRDLRCKLLRFPSTAKPNPPVYPSLLQLIPNPNQIQPNRTKLINLPPTGPPPIRPTPRPNLDLPCPPLRHPQKHLHPSRPRFQQQHQQPHLLPNHHPEIRHRPARNPDQNPRPRKRPLGLPDPARPRDHRLD